MEKNYLKPEIEIIKFRYNDVLMSSGEMEIIDEEGTQWSFFY